jgi:hypothetical protein
MMLSEQTLRALPPFQLPGAAFTARMAELLLGAKRKT